MCNPTKYLPINNSNNNKDNNNKNNNNSKIIFVECKSLLCLASPILVTSIILYTRSLISMVFLGRLGDSELAAGSLAIALANITGYSVLSGLSLGMEPLCSQAFGAKLPKLLTVTLQRGCVFLLACSVPISLIWVQVMPRILEIIINDNKYDYDNDNPNPNTNTNTSMDMMVMMNSTSTSNIVTMAYTYLLYSLPDLVTNSFLHPIRIYLRAQGITSPVTWASLAGTVLHLPLNLIFLRFGGGVASVAAASATANLFSLLFLALYIRRASGSIGGHRPPIMIMIRDCLTGWGPLTRLAGPSCLSVCLEWWWYEIMIVLCGFLKDHSNNMINNNHYSNIINNNKLAVASMGLLIQTTSLIYNFPSSLSFAVSTRVGNDLGAGRPNSARRSATVAVAASAVLGVAALLFAIGVRNHWGKIYTEDSDILQLTAAALPLLGMCELGNCPQTIASGVVRGTARPTTAANVNLAAFYLVGTPVAIVLAFYFNLGFIGLWIGLLAAQLSCACMMLFVVGTTDWDHQARRAHLLTTTTTTTTTSATAGPGPGPGGESGGLREPETEKEIINSINNKAGDDSVCVCVCVCVHDKTALMEPFICVDLLPSHQ